MASGSCVFESEKIDYSKIRQPIAISVTSMLDYIKCAESSTVEVQNILKNQVDVILECRACKSLFRSLPNLIAHKRVYCEHVNYSQFMPSPEFTSEVKTLVVEPTNPDDDLVYKSTRSKRKMQSEKIISDRVVSGSFDGKSEAYKLYTNALQKTQANKEKDTIVVKLESIEGNSTAKFQSVSLEDENFNFDESQSLKRNRDQSPCDLLVATSDTDSSRKKVKNNASNSKTKRQKKKKRRSAEDMKITKQLIAQTKAKKICQADVIEMKCKTCNSNFPNKKTLYSHITLMHSGKRMIYPCLYCECKFSQLWGVSRHMEQCHNKTKEDFLRVREKIKQKAIAVNNTLENVSMKEEATDSDDDNESLANIVKHDNQIIGKYKINEDESEAISDETRCKILTSRCKSKIDSDMEMNDMYNEQHPLTDDNDIIVAGYEGNHGIPKSVNLSECIVIHDKSRKIFKCPLCGNIYDKKDDLRQHIWHDNCTHLSETVSESENFDSSRLNPNDEQKFDMAWVNVYGLTTNQIMKVEEIIDRNQKKCLKCQRAFGVLSNLRHHAVRHLGIQRYQCKLCDFKGFMQSTVRSHLKRAHNKHVLDGQADVCNFIQTLVGDEPEVIIQENRRALNRYQTLEERRAAAAVAISKVTTLTDRDNQANAALRAGAMVVLQDIVNEFGKERSKCSNTNEEESDGDVYEIDECSADDISIQAMSVTESIVNGSVGLLNDASGSNDECGEPLLVIDDQSIAAVAVETVNSSS